MSNRLNALNIKNLALMAVFMIAAIGQMYAEGTAESSGISGQLSDKGRINLSSEVSGMILIDGVETGRQIKEQGMAILENIESGLTEIAIRLDDGAVIKADRVLVKPGETVNVHIASPKPSYYVRATGSDSNDGLSESKAFKTLKQAVSRAAAGDIKKITIIGTLDIRSEAPSANDNAVFVLDALFPSGVEIPEILITGKLGASGNERAVFSGLGSAKSVLHVKSGTFRFENIEISGSTRIGIDIVFGRSVSIITGSSGSASSSRSSKEPYVTLGQGAVVRNNNETGLFVGADGTLILAGGEVRDNKYIGVYVASLTDPSYNSKDGVFTMTDGIITNQSYAVVVEPGASYVRTGGTVTGTIGTVEPF